MFLIFSLQFENEDFFGHFSYMTLPAEPYLFISDVTDLHKLYYIYIYLPTVVMTDLLQL